MTRHMTLRMTPRVKRCMTRRVTARGWIRGADSLIKQPPH
jgi:hypothetical protein